jgi:hypothetical protein
VVTEERRFQRPGRPSIVLGRFENQDAFVGHLNFGGLPGWALVEAVCVRLQWIAGSVEPLISARPLLAALSGAAAGATVGGITGGLIGLGIPEIEAKRYENLIAEGKILISVVVKTGDEATRAKDVLKNAGAEDISVTSIGEVASSRG